jgi:hypothetical protein
MGGGYQGRFAGTVLCTSMDAGAAKLRGRFTAALRQIEVTFRMTAAQVAVLRVFYQETTGGGALPFDWVHPREGGVAEYRFMDAPRVSAATAVLFPVSLKLEQMPWGRFRLRRRGPVMPLRQPPRWVQMQN